MSTITEYSTKLLISSLALQRAVQHAQLLVARNPTVPILETVLIELTPETSQFTGEAYTALRVIGLRLPASGSSRVPAKL